MNDFLSKLLPMIIPMMLSQIVYCKIDKKKEITNKLSSKLGIQQEWLPFCAFLSSSIILLIMFYFGIPVLLFLALGGTVTGIVCGMQCNLSIKKGK
ncbi:hypothetical protein [Clostridium sp.]|uniref:hypothetical protein n=1 Tax=Clostridium sp. TaxID=1506 RepID=UPI0028429BB2|nr:hypothetical protein [Clostridium sp.]MDR3598749.1 hypothetical protein [Clostridium sp.]